MSSPICHTRAYTAWVEMRRRCRPISAKRREFLRYGGRGIRVCERWQTFANFLSDMGQPPVGMSLDRIDNDGNYDPGNCRWACPKTQSLNNRRAAYVELDGKRLRVREVEISLGLSQGALWHRIEDGWPLRKACTTPRVRP